MGPLRPPNREDDDPQSRDTSARDHAGPRIDHRPRRPLAGIADRGSTSPSPEVDAQALSLRPGRIPVLALEVGRSYPSRSRALGLRRRGATRRLSSDHGPAEPLPEFFGRHAPTQPRAALNSGGVGLSDNQEVQIWTSWN